MQEAITPGSGREIAHERLKLGRVEWQNRAQRDTLPFGSLNSLDQVKEITMGGQ